MRTILYIIQKEILQTFRNKAMLPIIFILPIVQMLILVFAATFEMREIRLVVVDMDRSQQSEALLSRFQGSPFYKFYDYQFSSNNVEDLLLRSEVDAVLQINSGFEKELILSQKADVQLLVDALNGTAAELVVAYTQQIIKGFNEDVIMNNVPIPGNYSKSEIKTSTNFWYNPELNFKFYMAPGVLVILVTIIGMMLGGMNLVREKEIGTIEQINVTPIRKYQFIAGKLIPFWLIGIFDLGFGLLIAKLAFNIPFVGSFSTLFVFTSVYLLVILSMGLLLSAVSNSQQQVTLMSFFFLIVFILMSGLFTPIESMPNWARNINLFNPLAYFVKIMRHIILKGSTVFDLWKDFVSLLIYGIVLLSLAVWRYRKTT